MRQDIINVQRALSQKIIGKDHQLKLAITCLLANGHLLIEDLPGMGKTTLSHALSQVFGLQYSRIQFTSDLLPSDMLGVNIFHSNEQDEAKRFSFRHGPIFSQVVLADELNRASPKTQSALLEAMEERQVSIDGVTHALPSPFFCYCYTKPKLSIGHLSLARVPTRPFLYAYLFGLSSVGSRKSHAIATGCISTACTNTK